MKISQEELLSTMDADVWARAFMEQNEFELENTSIDRDVMRGWFANAIMTAYDMGKNKGTSK